MHRTIGGLAVALSSFAAPGEAQSPPRLPLVQELRLDGATEDISGDYWQLELVSGGRFAFMNALDAQFVFFDRDGKRVGAFGAKGDGPGEFAPIRSGSGGFDVQTGMIGDTMWVYASTHRRFTLIGPDLKLARTLPLPPRDAALLGFTPMALLAGNRVLGTGTFGTDAQSQSQLMDRTQDTVVVIAPNGKVAQRLAKWPLDTVNVRGRRASGAPFSMRVPHMQRPQHFVSPTGDRFGFLSAVRSTTAGHDVRLSVFRSTGEPIFSRTYSLSGVEPVSKRELDSLVERNARSYSSPDHAQARATFRSRIPEVRSPVNSVTLGADGTVWIEREALGTAPRELFVVSPTGEVLGTAAFPRAGLNLVRATRTTVWATEIDADGFISIVRFRVGQ